MESNMNKFKIVASLVVIILCETMGFGDTYLADAEVKVVSTTATRAQLDNGVEIELLAISNWQWMHTWKRHLEATARIEGRNIDLWWRPDGTLWEDVDFRRGRQSSGNTSAFNFLVKVTGLEDGLVMVAKKLQGEVHRVYVGDICNSENESIKNHQVFYIDNFDYPPTKTSLFVGIASGPWLTIESNKFNWAENEPDSINWVFDSSITGKWPYQKGKDVRVELSHTYVNAQTRLEMVDKDGNVYPAEERQRSNGLGIVGVHYTFRNTQISDVDEIRFIKRDFNQWIEFKDVVLGVDAMKPFYTWGRLSALKGNPAPDFVKIQAWSTGNSLTLDDPKGKVVLLDFWNVNCPPCIAMFPKLISLHEKYYDKGLRIVGVHADIGLSTSEAKAKISGYKKNIWKIQTIPFPIAFDGGGDTQRPNTTAQSWGATNAAYAITSYPTSILIDKSGNVVGEINLHKEVYEKQIDLLLNQ
jgi:thiol-disulfide isomerase/thioredoxin